MRAAVTTESGGFEVVHLPDPYPGPDQLIIAVEGCGVCGSDLKAQPFMPPGTVMGHEFGGTVVAVGRDATASGWCEGTSVAVLPVVSCGSCSWCDSGDVAHCGSTRFIGMGPDAGGFAELAAVPAVHAFPLPDDMPVLHASLVEPFAVGLHAITTAELRPGEDVLVIGAGGVGLTTIAWARALEAGRVTVVDPDPIRRRAAQAIGANDVRASVDDVEPRSQNVVVECVGRAELIAAAATVARARGRVVISGACDQPVNVEPIAALLNELSFRWSVAYRPDEFRRVIDAFRTGRIDPAAAVGVILELEQVAQAFDLVRAANTEGRVLVRPVRGDG